MKLLSPFIAHSTLDPAPMGVMVNSVVALEANGFRNSSFVFTLRLGRLSAAQLVDEAAGLIGFDALGDPWLLQRGAQLVETLGAVGSVKYPSCQAR